MADILLLAHPYGTLIAVLVTSGWALGEYLKYRRLEKFGDRRILGVERRWIPKVAGIVLIALGMASIAAIVFPSRRPGSAGPSNSPETRMCLDSASLAPSGSSGSNQWDLLEALVAAIPAGDKGHLLALYRLTSPTQPVIPPTADLAGYRILLKRLRIEWSAAAEAGFGEAPAGLDELAAPGSGHAVLLLTGREPEDIAHRLNAGAMSAGRIAVAQLRKEDSTVHYWHRSRDGAWIRGEGIGELAAWIAAAARDEESGARLFGRNHAMRSLALAALALLLAEFLLAGYWPGRVRGRTGA